jgi:hypothetical protein
MDIPILIDTRRFVTGFKPALVRYARESMAHGRGTSHASRALLQCNKLTYGLEIAMCILMRA